MFIANMAAVFIIHPEHHFILKQMSGLYRYCASVAETSVFSQL